jgi:hypothetical protein
VDKGLELIIGFRPQNLQEPGCEERAKIDRLLFSDAIGQHVDVQRFPSHGLDNGAGAGIGARISPMRRVA